MGFASEPTFRAGRCRFLHAAFALLVVVAAVGCGLQDAPKFKGPTSEGQGSFTVPPDLTHQDLPGVIPEVIITPPPQDAGKTCGNGVLDDGEICDPGLDACCNDTCDGVLAKDTVCRPAKGDCDTTEACDGKSAACPDDAIASADAVCRPAADACDAAESCDGTHKQCPPDAFLAVDTPCRAEMGDCDVPETCTGLSAACPEDAVAARDQECRAAVGLCDAPELCDGTHKDCPGDAVLAQGVMCELPTDLCDAAEVCDGASKDCPSTLTTVQPFGILCGSAQARCQLDAVCSGEGTACPGNATAADGTACDDGRATTVNDVCTTGVCAGIDHCVAVTCTPSDQCHVAGVCDHASGACSNPVKQSGSTCDDGNGNTVNDACAGGICVGIDLCVNGTCTASDQCHVAGVCNPTSGLCDNPNKQDGSICNDGDPNTVNDVCAAGVCAGTDLCAGVTCSPLDQCHLAGVCNHANGQCSNPDRQDGSNCNDGNGNTINDVCTTGVCAGTDLCANVTCIALDQCHVAGVCNHGNGQCSNPVKSDGTGCDDGNACTQTDKCMTGACVGSNAVTCSAQDQCHVAGTCNPANGTCSNPNAGDGTGCNDGNACTQTDKCMTGVCVGSNPVTCTAQDQCHVAGTCNPANGSCSNPNAGDGIGCDDGNACTQSDKCMTGVCVGSNPVTCTAQDQCHVAGTCNPANGSCSNPSATDGTSCSDSNACTRTDKCMTGVCVGSNPVTCTAQDQCHVAGTCNTTTGSCSNPNATNGIGCDDGNACTQTDQCSGGACVGSNPVACAPQDQCHVAGTCNPADGTCSNPNATDGTGCSDNNACTQTDKCMAGACVGSNPVVCAALDRCHSVGACNVANGQCSNPGKSDGQACNYAAGTDPGPGTCWSGVCCPGATRYVATDNGCEVPGRRVVFVSSKSYTGALGGLVPADQLCQGLASGAQLASTYTAWLSTAGALAPGINAVNRIGGGPYVRVDGNQVAADKTALTSGTLAAPIELSEWANQTDTKVWTATASNGTTTNLACSNWTSGSATVTGSFGSSNATDVTWTISQVTLGQPDTATCDTSYAVYCFQDDCPGEPIVDFKNDPTNCGSCGNACKSWQTCIQGNCGDYVFVSSTNVGGGSGVANADKQCTTLANNAGLKGTFAAWLDDAGTMAPKRIVDSAYYLVDGTLVAKDLQSLLSAASAASPLLSPIDLTEAGASTQAPRVWTGTKADGSFAYDPPAGTGGDCRNLQTGGPPWTSSSGTGTYGIPTAVDGTWTDSGLTFTCDASAALYCFQIDR